MKKLLVVIFVLTSGIAFADPAPMTIYAWGYGDILTNVFQAIKYMVGSSGYLALFKIAALIGILSFLISAIALKGQVSLYMLAMRFGFAIVLWSLISLNSSFKTDTDIAVYDVYTNTTYPTVEDVPLGFAGPLHFFSKMEYWFNDLIQKAFSITDAGIAASGMGYVPPSIGAGLVYSASQYRITDPNLYMTMNDYMTDCVFPDVLTGYFDPYDLQTSTTFWNSIKDTHPARVSKVYDPVAYPGQNGHMLSCPDVWTALNDNFTRYIPNAANYLNQTMGLAAETATGTLLGTAAQKLLGISQTGTSFLLNSVALNSFDDAVQSAAAIGGVSGEALGFGLAKSQETTRANMVMTGIQTKKYLPMTKGILICVLMCSLPVFFAFVVAMQLPGKLLGMVIGMFLAPCFWAFGDAILNFIVMVKANSYITNWGGFSAISAQTKPIVETQTLEMVNMVSSMYGIIPTMALGFATLSAYALSSLTGSAIGAATAGTSGAAAEMATGSISMGNVTANNYRANTMDTARMLNTGYGYNHSQTYRNIIDSRLQNTNSYESGSTSSTMLTEDRNIGGLNWKKGATVKTNMSDGTATIEGNTELGKTFMQLSGYGTDKQKMERLDAKSGENVAMEQVKIDNINSLALTDQNGNTRTISGAKIMTTGKGEDATSVIAGVDKTTGSNVSMTMSGLAISPVVTEGGVTSDYLPIMDIKQSDLKEQAQGTGTLISSHIQSGSTGEHTYGTLYINGEKFTGVSVKTRGDGKGVDITGYSGEGDNRVHNTIWAKDFNAADAADGRINNVPFIDRKQAAGDSERYDYSYFKTKEKVTIGAVASETHNGITTGTSGKWTEQGDLRTYTGSMSWTDKDGVHRTGAGSMMLSDGKMLHAYATNGTDFMRVDRDGSTFDRVDNFREGDSTSGQLQASLTGSEYGKVVQAAYDNWAVLNGQLLKMSENHRIEKAALAAQYKNGEIAAAEYRGRIAEINDNEEYRTLGIKTNAANMEKQRVYLNMAGDVSREFGAYMSQRLSTSHTEGKETKEMMSFSIGGKVGGQAGAGKNSGPLNVGVSASAKSGGNYTYQVTSSVGDSASKTQEFNDTTKLLMHLYDLNGGDADAVNAQLYKQIAEKR
jgi:hypothetical protein